jgi:GDP-4-dehydro-6-deoxy-D-mannose reductase
MTRDASDRLGDGADVRPGDISDKDYVSSVVESFQPERIYHLAAQSMPERSWQEPQRTFQVNVHGSIYLLEAARAMARLPQVIMVCSSSEYAPSPEGAPIREEDPLHPGSLYGVSKLVQDQMGELYTSRYELPIQRVRPFFVVGPGKEGDVCSDFARRVLAVAAGTSNDLPVGNLEVVRDILDIRDAVRALQVIANQGEAGEVYNLCSGQGYSVRQILETFKDLAGVTLAERVDPDLVRPIDDMVKVGDPSRLHAMGWHPEYTFEQTLGDILAYWKNREAM